METQKRFLAACRGGTPDRPPLWIMRQAGRYLPEYRALREKHSFLEVCRTPELAAEATRQPLRRFGFDAAILFSDILVVPEAMGLELSFPEGGPLLAPAVRAAADVDALRVPDVETSLGYVAAALRAVKAGLPEDAALIGFSGAPFTLAAYMTPAPAAGERWREAKLLAFRDEGLFSALCEKLTATVIAYLKMQIAAGAEAVQLFDTWAGQLAPRDYERRVLPWVRRIFDALAGLGAPRILYVNGAAGLLELMAESGADVLGLDWRVDPARARRRLGERIALQGNLDPLLLFAPPETIRRAVRELHESLGGRGHVFNLGHGILPDTPLAGVRALCDAVRELGA